MGWGQDALDAVARAVQDTYRTASVIGAAVDRGSADVVSIGCSDQDLFEIGSLTKPLLATAVLAAEANGLLSLDDAVDRWIPSPLQVTVRDLLTHQSGLPRLAPNWDSFDGFSEDDPYNGFDQALAIEGLRSASLAQVGTVSYSNFGYQLLGICLERVTVASLDAIFARDVFEPAGMVDATASAAADAVPAFFGTEAVTPWRLTLPGPGGVRASARDLAALVTHVTSTGHASAWTAGLLAPEALISSKGRSLAWFVDPDGIRWHNGGTGGFRTMLAADLNAGRGVAISVNNGDLDDLDEWVMSALVGSPTDVERGGEAPVTWAASTIAFVRALDRGDVAAARADLAAQFSEAFSDDDLRAAWRHATDEGSLASVAVTSVRERRGAIHVDLAVATTCRNVRVRSVIDSDGKLASIQLT